MMLRARSRFWLLLLLAVVLGLGLRLYFFFHWAQVNGDGLVYGDIARNLLRHGIYGRSSSTPAGMELHPTLIRLPGYPLFLAGCFVLFGMEHYHAVLFLQIAIDLGSCLLIARFVYRFLGPRAALIALYLAALCPFTANYTAAPLTETLSLFSIAVAINGLLRLLTRADALAVALCAASWSLLTLLRPDGALLPAAFVPAILVYSRTPILSFPALGLRRAAKLALLCGLLSVLPFFAWTWRNWRTFHLFEPLAPRYATDPGEFTEPGFNRWMKTWAAEFTSTYEIYWTANADQMPFDSLPGRVFDSPAQRQTTAALFAACNEDTTITPALDDRFAALAAERIHTHPLRYYAWLPAMRVADMWLRPRTENLNIELRWWQFDRHNGETLFAAAYGALNLFYLAAAAIGVFRWRRHGQVRLIGALLLYLMLRNVLLGTIEAPEARYTIEGFPILIAWASAAFIRSERIARSQSTSG